MAQLSGAVILTMEANGGVGRQFVTGALARSAVRSMPLPAARGHQRSSTPLRPQRRYSASKAEAH